MGRLSEWAAVSHWAGAFQAHFVHALRRPASRNHACCNILPHPGFFQLKVFLMADSLALLEDGSVWAWGSNMDGQLGTCGQAPSSNASASELSEQPEGGTHAVQSCAARLSSGRPDPFRCRSSAVQQPATTPHIALIALLQTGSGIATIRGGKAGCMWSACAMH